ncbi:MAG: filamentous hemagglutinin N-terminal domain-containing protein, partial [Candidatus Omnitrophica bacterium]|nr:filamentous hemagglutinin N-terminal domain-containing protein [Candidatus Omnitrophota bacterium]
PSGAKVESGDVQISQPDANTLNVSASDHAIINWQSFGIAQNEIVNFSQPFSSAAVLNNVTGGEMSVIAGTLNANGNVYLVNPAGIYFSPTAEVNVGGLIASSLSISSQNFLEDKMLFERPDGTRVGAVINAGQIMVARPGAVVAMIGNVVKNEGVIVANLGHVALASGDRVTMSFDSKGLLQVDVTEAVSENAFQDVEVPISSAVENSGKIEANGGTVLLTGDELGQLFERVVNQSGVIEADSVGTYRGRVVLNAGRGSAVVSGEIETRGTKTTGGEIRILGEDVKLLGATLDASGDLGGGTVLVGGDYQGKADTPTAFHTFVDASSVIKADARVAGDGGKVILWSESSTLYYGNISGRGGDESGNGGFAEVSGKIYLDYDGRTDLRAPNGAIGTLLLDPNNITISIGANANMSSSGGDPNTYTTTANSGILNTTTLNAALGLASVVVQTGTAGLNSQPGNITVANTITAPANANNLTLSAHNNIAISTGATIDMSASSGNLTLTADSDASGVGAISRAGTGTIAMGTGTLSMTAGSGIGTSALPMQTTGLTNVSANTGTGGIFITNATSGNINITGLTTTTGAASTGGNISVTNSFAGGSITVSGAITGGANAAGSTGNILLTATGGNIIVNADLTTGNATLADTGAVNAVASGSITLNTGAGAGDVTGIGALITGSAILTGAAGAGADTATSGTITITATSGAIGLSHANALQTGAASRTGAGAGTDTATVGNIVLSSATEINNGTASTAMTFTPGTPSGAATNNFGTLAVTTTSGAAGNAFLSASNQIRLAASTIAKDFQLTTTGSITQTGTQTITGTSSFTAGANAITLATATNNFTGAVSLSNSGANNVSIRDANAIILGTVTVGSGTLTVTAVGITQTGAITQAVAAGTASFAGGAGVVTLTNAGNDFTGSVGITNSGANAVSVTDANAIVLGTMTVGTSTLTVNATGAITQTGIITQAAAAGAVTFNAGANPITLTDASNNFIGAVSLNNSGANDVAIRDVNAIVLGASAVGSGTLTVNASGAITQTGAIIQAAAAGTSTFNAGAGAITLTTATNNFTGAVSLNNSGANSVSIRDTNAIVLGDSAVGSGTLTVTAVGITQTGAITQAAGAGTASFVGGAGVITLTNAANDFTGTVTLSNSGANDVSITDVNALTLGASPTGLGNLTVTVGGTLTISGAVSTAVNAAGSTGNISMTTTAGNIVINANVSTGNASQADSAAVETPTSGSITFVSAGSISGTGSTITGTATITGVVAAGADVVTSGSISLTASGGGIGLSNATALRVGTASRTGAVDDTAVAGSITLSSVDEINNNTASTAMTIAIGAASGATVNTQGTLAVTTTGAAGNIFITSASVLRVDGITTSGASSQTVTLTTTGAVALTLNDVARTLTDDAVTFGTGTGLLTITNTVNPIDVAAGSLILTSNTLTVTGGANTLRGDGGAITIQPSSVGTSIGVAGAAGTLQVTTAINTAMQDGFSSITIGRSNGTGAVTVNAITFKDNVTIRSSAAGGTITVNGALTTGSGTQAGTITLNAGSGVTITNVAVRTEGQAIDINADVDANGTGAITISGAASRIDTTNLGAAPAGANITLRGSGFTSTGPAASITAGTSGAVNFYTSLASTTMGFGGAAGTYNLTDAEIATVGSAGTIRFGEAGVESGAVGVQTVTSPVASAAIEVNSNVGAGSVALDDAGAATALATGGSGNVTVRAGSGGVTATQATGARAEISTTGTISIIASGPVGTATNRIQFLAGQTDVGITTTGATGNVFLGGLGSLSLGACSISGTLDIVTSGAITQSGALTVTGTTTMISGAGTNITLTTAGNSFAGTLTLSGADINVSAGAMMTLGAITATGVITLTTSAGDILDGNGAANNLTAAADSSLTAAGVVGTVADPIEVTITGATLTVEAGARILLVSAVIDGTVTPSNRLLSSGRSPGQIIFNGSILYNPFAEAPPEGSLPSLVGAYTSIDTINQMIIEAKDVQGITTDPFLNKRVWSIAPRRVGLSLRS